MPMAGGGPDKWENERSRLTYEEARIVIDHQRDVINDIDNKAMYTVRVIVIFLSILVAAFRIGGADIFNQYLFWPGISSLVISMAVGIYTYRSSNLFLGPNRAYLQNLSENDVDADRWDRDLINRFADWVNSNHQDLEENGLLLLLSQVTLIVGIVLLGLSVAL